MPDSPFNPNARPEFPWPADMRHPFDPDAPPGVLAAGFPAPEPPAPEPPAAPVQLDRYGRNPADVRAMLTERARQQYERRFGTHAPGQGTASMASQGQAQDLDSLIRRLSGVGAIGLPTDAQYARMDRMRR